jgi:cellulose biosynthesis protein BcsQ
MAGESNEFAIESIVQLAMPGYAIARTAGTTRPDVMLLELTEFDRDLPQAAAIHRHFPDVPLVGLASRDLQLLLDRSPNSDLASFAVWPFSVAQLEQAIRSAVHKFHHGIHENLVAFLPGKAGSGASTVVLHTARVITHALERRVLVIEGDLHSGLLSAMLQVEPRFSIREVLAEAPRIDNLSWQRYVTSAGGTDFVLTNTAIKEPAPAWTHYFQILRFATPKYDLVMADLPEVVNLATAEIVRRARTVYVVSTPELASLKLSKQRCQELDHWGVDRGRIQALLNRGHKNDIGPKDAERILDCPVATTFPNDYRAVRRAPSMEVSLTNVPISAKRTLRFPEYLPVRRPRRSRSWGCFGNSPPPKMKELAPSAAKVVLHGDHNLLIIVGASDLLIRQHGVREEQFSSVPRSDWVCSAAGRDLALALRRAHA